MHLLFVLIEFAIVLGIMVLVHELGHFLMAKLCGVRVEVFSIGMPPRLFGFRYGDTDYRISLLPLGGYVKMAGEYGSDTSTGAPWEFTSKPRWQRCLIALSGPCANFLLSFFLLFLVAHFHHEVDQYLNGPAVVDYVPANTPAARDGLTAGDTITSFNHRDHPTWEQILDECALNLNQTLPLTFVHDGHTFATSLLIATGGGGDSELSRESMETVGLIPRMAPGPVGVQSVTGGTPAERAGLRAGDQVVRIDSLDIHSVFTLLAYLRDSNGAPAHLLVLRHGQPLQLLATPETMQIPGAATQYRLGFTPVQPPVQIEPLPIGKAIRQSLKDNRDDSTLILRVLQGLFTRHVSVRQMSGPVGIAQQIDIATQLGLWTLIRLMSTISLNLGIFNLLPFPPLDGGMILFLLIESVMRRDVNQGVKDRIYQIAFVCVIFLAIFVMVNDIAKLHLGRP
jgi:regulator of sigma E protease